MNDDRRSDIEIDLIEKVIDEWVKEVHYTASALSSMQSREYDWLLKLANKMETFKYGYIVGRKVNP